MKVFWVEVYEVDEVVELGDDEFGFEEEFGEDCSGFDVFVEGYSGIINFHY